MAKTKKDSKPLSIRMDRSTFDRLNEYCGDSGQSKTIAIERAINQYIDNYNLKMKLLNEKQ